MWWYTGFTFWCCVEMPIWLCNQCALIIMYDHVTSIHTFGVHCTFCGGLCWPLCLGSKCGGAVWPNWDPHNDHDTETEISSWLEASSAFTWGCFLVNCNLLVVLVDLSVPLLINPQSENCNQAIVTSIALQCRMRAPVETNKSVYPLPTVQINLLEFDLVADGYWTSARYHASFFEINHFHWIVTGWCYERKTSRKNSLLLRKTTSLATQNMKP